MRIFVSTMHLIRTIASFVLALLVLVSSTSFMVGLHICRGHVKNIAVMKEAKPCAMELLAMDMSLPGDSCGRMNMKGCCENRTLFFEGNDYKYKTSQQYIPANLIAASVLLPPVIAAIDLNDSSHLSLFLSYKPPLIHRDVPVWVQSFLI